MSLFPQKADIRQREGDVRLVPKADVRHRRPVLVANNTGKGRSAAWRVCQQYDARSSRRRRPKYAAPHPRRMAIPLAVL